MSEKLLNAKAKLALTTVITTALVYIGFLAWSTGASGIQLIFPLLALALGAFCSIMPCCLPIFPGYIGILSEKGKNVSPTGVFVKFFTGHILMVLLLGALVVFLAQQTATIMWLKFAAAIFIMIIGSDMLLGAYNLPSLNLMSKMPSIASGAKAQDRGLIGTGALFGAATTPCALLVLTPILAYGLTVSNALLNISAFILYGVGKATPYLVITYTAEANRDRVFSFLAEKGSLVKKTVAVLILTAGFLMLIWPIYIQPGHHTLPWNQHEHTHTVEEFGAPIPIIANQTTVEMTHAFEPAVIKIEPGTTVTWTNKGPRNSVTQASKDWTSVDSPVFASGMMMKGERYSHTFNETGIYYYWSQTMKNHMRGKIIVANNVTKTGKAHPDHGHEH